MGRRKASSEYMCKTRRCGISCQQHLGNGNARPWRQGLAAGTLICLLHSYPVMSEKPVRVPPASFECPILASSPLQGLTARRCEDEGCPISSQPYQDEHERGAAVRICITSSLGIWPVVAGRCGLDSSSPAEAVARRHFRHHNRMCHTSFLYDHKRVSLALLDCRNLLRGRHIRTLCACYKRVAVVILVSARVRWRA